MNVKNISWISKDADEAIVTVVDNKNFSLNCFSQPCEYYINDKIDCLYTFNVYNIKRSNIKRFVIEKNNNDLGYYLVGKIINLKRKIIKINDFKLELDNDIPVDIKEKEFIEFTCSRIDLY